MSFLRRLLGGSTPSLPPAVPIGGNGDPEDEQLCIVTVGDVAIPAAIYHGYQRDVQDWSSGIRLEHPTRGFMLMRESDYPPELIDAGARVVALAGIQHHPDAQRGDFGVGRFVLLRPDPANPVNPNALAIWSSDGRYLAGYVPEDDLERIRAATPRPVVGLVVWDHWTWRPRTRLGIRILLGPSIQLVTVKSGAVPAERARRDATYAAGRAAWDAEQQAELAARREQKRLAEEVRLAAKQDRERRRQEAEARKTLVSQWRSLGLCVDCGAAIAPRTGRGLPPVRCEIHARTSNAAGQ